jgi:hypothetical protein
VKDNFLGKGEEEIGVKGRAEIALCFGLPLIEGQRGTLIWQIM